MFKAQQFIEQFAQNETLDESLYPLVRDICEEVKLKGDHALKIII